MTVIALASIKGSPGVTAAALALAWCWPPERSALIECDPAGGDLAASLGLSTTPGLVSLTAAVRRSPDIDQVWRHAHALPGGTRVVVAPVGSEQARATVRTLGESKLVEILADAADMVVVIDCGRLDPDSPALALARQATMVMLCLRPRRDELAHLAPRVPALLRDLPAPRLVLVGPEEFPAREISDAMRMPVIAHLPRDPHGAGVLFTSGLRKGSAARLPLLRAVRTLADELGRSAVFAAADRRGRRVVPPNSWGVGWSAGSEREATRS